MERKELLAVVKVLNKEKDLLEKIEMEKIPVVGKGTKLEDLQENFKKVMLALDDAELIDETPEDCIDFWEEHLEEFVGEVEEEVEEEEVEEEVEEEEVEEEKVEEKETPKPIIKPKWKTAIEIIVNNPDISTEDLIKKMIDEPCGSYVEGTAEAYRREISYAIRLYEQKKK